MKFNFENGPLFNVHCMATPDCLLRFEVINVCYFIRFILRLSNDILGFVLALKVWSYTRSVRNGRTLHLVRCNERACRVRTRAPSTSRYENVQKPGSSVGLCQVGSGNAQNTPAPVCGLTAFRAGVSVETIYVQRGPRRVVRV